jgi:hypothetical protein
MTSGQWETMSMKTIDRAPSGSGVRNAQGANYPVNKLNTMDIIGAQASTTRERRERKLNSAHRNLHDTRDIDGAHPQVLIPKETNKPNDRHLRNDDIEWSKPICRQMRTNRNVNPLNPEYTYPSVDYKPQTPVKLIRDTNVTHDINQKELRMDFSTRNNIDYSDVNGPKIRSNPNKPFDNLQVRDINNDMVFKSQRSTNPLSPRYRYDVPPKKNVSNWEIGNVKDSHPRKLPETRNDRPLFSLRTEDIEHMKQPQAHHLPPSFPVQRRQYRTINYIQDIQGTSSGQKYSTFHQSKRITNPLNPSYKF